MVNNKLVRLYEILRHNLMLDLENKQENIRKFEEIAKQIDEDNQETYDKEYKEQLYKTTSLENESKRLEELVSFIEKREESRRKLLDDFYQVTGKILTSLEPIKGSEEINDYRDRLGYINEYLNNKSQLERLSYEINELEEQLKKNNKVRVNNENKNKEYEEELLDTFTKIISNNHKLSELKIKSKSLEDINFLLGKLSKEVETNKEHLDTYTSCYNALLEAGITGEEKRKYQEYTNLAIDEYYEVKEKEYLYRIYKMLIDEQYEYEGIFEKRLNLKNILEEREALREKLAIDSPDLLYNFFLVADEQYQEIFNQQASIETINHLNERISFDKERQEILENANQNVEILAILNEYNLIPVYEEEQEISTSEIKDVEEASELTKETMDEIPNDEPEIEAEIDEPIYHDSNAIVGVTESNLDFKVYSKALDVMKQVGKSLNISVEEPPRKDDLEIIPKIVNTSVSPVEEKTNIFEDNNNIFEKNEDIIPKIENKEDKNDHDSFLESIAQVNNENFFSDKEMSDLLKNKEKDDEEEPLDDMPILPNFGTVHPVNDSSEFDELMKSMPKMSFPDLDDNDQDIKINGDDYFEKFPDLFGKDA